MSAATYILTNLTTRVGRALFLLPAVGVALVQQAVASATYLGNSLVTTLGDAMRDLPDVELAFDRVVQGLVGPNGLVGNVIELTVGRGVATGAPDTPFIPSVRSLVSGVTGGTSQDIVNPAVPSALAAGLDASIARATMGDDNTDSSARGAGQTPAGGNSDVATDGSEEAVSRPGANWPTRLSSRHGNAQPAAQEGPRHGLSRPG